MDLSNSSFPDRLNQLSKNMITIQDFCYKLTTDQLDHLKRHKLDCRANQEDAHCTFNDGRKYFKILTGSKSVRYFVRKSDGMIFASASWQHPNLNRSFGTLETINDFYWGNYEAVPIQDTGWKMVPTKFGYYTTERVS